MNSQTLQLLNEMTAAERREYRCRVINIQNARRDIDAINSNTTLGELGKLTKAEKAEKKRLQRIEKAERKALYRLTSKKAREKMAKRAKKAKRKLAKSIKKGRASGFIAKLNSRGPVTLPLTPTEESLRQASVAGDFIAMNAIAPFGPAALIWVDKTTMGKYRFEIQNGRPLYIPWSEYDIDNFLNGPWFVQNPQTGLADLIHPRRKRGFDLADKKKKYMNHLAKAQKYPATDIRSMGMIEPGVYQISHGISSTWVKIRTPVMVAVAVVAAVYLGPAIVAKVKTLGAGGATAEGAATGVTAGGATTATTSAKIFAGAQQLTGYVNKARTINAIANGEMPPPPVTIGGSNFTDWAMIEAKEKFMEDMQRKMTEAEERQMRREIEAMQRELEKIIPPGVPIEPAPELNTTVKQMQVVEEKKAADVAKIMQFAIPAVIGFMVLRGFA